MRVFFDSKLIYKTKTNANGQLFQMQLYFCSNKKTYLQHLQSQNVSMHFVKIKPHSEKLHDSCGSFEDL